MYSSEGRGTPLRAVRGAGCRTSFLSAIAVGKDGDVVR